MMMYQTTVVGFVARDGASPTIDGVDVVSTITDQEFARLRARLVQ
jgi:hypothetical protein